MAKKKKGVKTKVDKEKEPEKVEPDKVEKPESAEKEPEKPEPVKAAEPENKKEKITEELVDEACSKLGISKDSVAKVVRENNNLLIETKPPESKKIRYEV